MTERTPEDRGEIRLHLLVLQCQAGDEDAFTRLMEWFGGRTRRYLRGLVGEDADDVQQEVWLAVYRGISRLTDPRAFRTWLYRTTRHRAIYHLRARRRERDLFAPGDGLDLIPAGESADTGEVEGSVIDAFIDRLAALHQEVLTLRFRDELSYAEIALVTGCSVGTVRSRLHYAKRHLQALLTRGENERRISGATAKRGQHDGAD